MHTAAYAIESAGDSLALRQRAANRLILQLQLDAYAELEDVDCLDQHVARIASRLGISAYTQEQWTLFIDFLHRWLPLFRTHIITKAHLQFEHYRKLLNVLSTVDCLLPEDADYAEIMDAIDHFLVERTTATRDNQATPTPAMLARALKKFLEGLHISAATQQNEHYCEVSFRPTNVPGLSTMSWTGPSEAILTVERAIRNFANTHNLSFAKACETYLTEHPHHEQRTTITLLGFAETPPNPIPTYIVGAGELTEEQQKILHNTQMHYHCVADVTNILGKDYAPTLAQHTFVKLRDGTCRFPGCTRDAIDCQTDHVINHADGGWTATGNLQSLCQHHHNMKTDRRVHATMDPYGIVTWHFPNGETITTEPTGKLAGIFSNPKAITTRWGNHPLIKSQAPPANNGLGYWGYTLEQRLARKRRKSVQGPPKSAK